MKYLLRGGTALAVSFLLAACQGAVTTKEPEPQPPVPTAAELLQGSWRFSAPWTDDDDVLVGKLIVTVTFTKSRWIKQRSYVYDSGELDSPWPNSEQGGWSATDNAVTITYHERGDDDMLPEEPEQFDIEYVWLDVARTKLLLQEWNGVPYSDYLPYTKVNEPVSLDGSWTFAFESDEGYTESWTMSITGETLLWVYDDGMDPDPGEESWNIVGVDGDELFITLRDTHDEERTARIAYAAGFHDGAIAVSPYWDEGNWDEDTGSWSPHPNWPHGHYWMLMRRNAE